MTQQLTVRHRQVKTNGLSMHIAEAGEGPLVLLLHGFPECWYSWRHQLPALAAAGFHAVAPDQRGYGETDAPDEIGAYNIFQVTGDMVGLVDALGAEEAVVVGHDWGVHVAVQCALLRPDVFRSVALLSVPFSPPTWDDPSPFEQFRSWTPDGMDFYILYFQEPGPAEAELEKDLRSTILKFLFGTSGDATDEGRLQMMFPKGTGMLDQVVLPDQLPAWLTDDDVQVYVDAFKRSGFRGPLNWYRNMETNRQQLPFQNGVRLVAPSLFICGAEDPVFTVMKPVIDNLDVGMPNLQDKVIVDGAGHWVQQERPNEVNEALLTFLRNSL